jgi:hypothetical protein
MAVQALGESYQHSALARHADELEQAGQRGRVDVLEIVDADHHRHPGGKLAQGCGHLLGDARGVGVTDVSGESRPDVLRKRRAVEELPDHGER